MAGAAAGRRAAGQSDSVDQDHPAESAVAAAENAFAAAAPDLHKIIAKYFWGNISFRANMCDFSLTNIGSEQNPTHPIARVELYWSEGKAKIFFDVCRYST